MERSDLYRGIEKHKFLLSYRKSFADQDTEKELFLLQFGCFV